MKKNISHCSTYDNFNEYINTQLDKFLERFKNKNEQKYLISNNLSDTIEELATELNKIKSKISKANYEKLIEIINAKSQLAWNKVTSYNSN